MAPLGSSRFSRIFPVPEKQGDAANTTAAVLAASPFLCRFYALSVSALSGSASPLPASSGTSILFSDISAFASLMPPYKHLPAGTAPKNFIT